MSRGFSARHPSVCSSLGLTPSQPCHLETLVGESYVRCLALSQKPACAGKLGSRPHSSLSQASESLFPALKCFTFCTKVYVVTPQRRRAQASLLLTWGSPANLPPNLHHVSTIRERYCRVVQVVRAHVVEVWAPLSLPRLPSDDKDKGGRVGWMHEFRGS